MGSHGLRLSDDEVLRRFFYTKVTPFTIIYSCKCTKYARGVCNYKTPILHLMQFHHNCEEHLKCVQIEKVRKFTNSLLPNAKPIRGLPKYKESSKLKSTVRQSRCESPIRSRERDERRRSAFTDQSRARPRSLRREGHSYSDATNTNTIVGTSTNTFRRPTSSSAKRTGTKYVKPLSIADLKVKDEPTYMALTNTSVDIPFRSSGDSDVTDKRKSSSPEQLQSSTKRRKNRSRSSRTANTKKDEKDTDVSTDVEAANTVQSCTDLSESQEDALLNQDVQMSFDLTATGLTLHDTISSDTELKSSAPTVTNTEVMNTPPPVQTEMSAVDLMSTSIVESVIQGAVDTFRANTPPLQTSETKDQEMEAKLQQQLKEPSPVHVQPVTPVDTVQTDATKPSTNTGARPKKVRMVTPPKLEMSPIIHKGNWSPQWTTLRNLQLPAIPTGRVASPYEVYDTLTGVPQQFTEMGTLIMSDTIQVQEMPNTTTFFSEGPLDVGVFFVTRQDGSPTCYCTVTLHPTNPRWKEFTDRYSQFNPFDYPIYAVTCDYRYKPACTSHYICLSKYIPPGEYRLVDNTPTRQQIHKIFLREHVNQFGKPQGLRVIGGLVKR